MSLFHPHIQFDIGQTYYQLIAKFGPYKKVKYKFSNNFLYGARHFDNLEMNFESFLGVKLEVSKLYWEIHHLRQKKILVHLTAPHKSTAGVNTPFIK